MSNIQIVSVRKVRYSVVFAIVSQRENNGGQKKEEKKILQIVSVLKVRYSLVFCYCFTEGK